MLRATLNEPIPLQALAADGRTTAFARATVYDDTGTVITTVSLPHIAGGLYGGMYTFTQEGFYTSVYEFFEDSGFTTPAEYDLEGESVEVNSDKTNILRILGIVHHNTVFDNQVYDGAGNLTSGRLRIYDTKANAEAAGTTGLLFEYDITAQYTSGELSNYRMTKIT